MGSPLERVFEPGKAAALYCRTFFIDIKLTEGYNNSIVLYICSALTGWDRESI